MPERQPATSLTVVIRPLLVKEMPVAEVEVDGRNATPVGKLTHSQTRNTRMGGKHGLLAILTPHCSVSLVTSDLIDGNLCLRSHGRTEKQQQWDAGAAGHCRVSAS